MEHASSKIFFVGIKGVGVIGIATLYKQWGYDVAGSDGPEEFFTDRILSDLGIPVYAFGQELITRDIEKVIYSTAYGADHPQIRRARELSIPCISYAEALEEIFNAKRGILVTGTHGKTTSSAMLGRVLEDADFDPTVVVGGELIEWGRTARGGNSAWMVSEGDEYQAKILRLHPEVLLITNIEYDHPDFYPDEASYFKVFEDMLASLAPDATVVAHEVLREFIEKHWSGRTIYFSSSNDELPALFLWGEHNRTNTLGALAVADVLGIDRNTASATLKHFRGTKRRMELYTGQDDDIVILDDYAHHPTEIRATLAALRERYPARKIIAVFQPHTYSRTKALLKDFAGAFRDANTACVLEVYGSAREKEATVSSRDLIAEAGKTHADIHYASDLDEAYRFLDLRREPGTVVVTLGAGDVWLLAKRFATLRAGQR